MKKKRNGNVIYQVKLSPGTKAVIAGCRVNRSPCNEMNTFKFIDQPGLRSLTEEEDTTERSSISTPEETSCDSSEKSASVQKYE